MSEGFVLTQWSLMPIYSYQCTKCSFQEDILLPFNRIDDSRLHCNAEMKRIVSACNYTRRLPVRERVLGGLNTNKNMNPMHAKMAMEGFN